MKNGVRTPEVGLYLLLPGPKRSLRAFSLTVDGKNVAHKDFLASFSVTFEDGEDDSADVILHFNTTQLDLRPFKKGVRFALVWGYRGESKGSADMILDKVKGRYSTAGYTITLSLISTIAYSNKYDFDPSIENRLDKVGGYLEYMYYNSDSKDWVTLKFYPGEETRWGVEAELKDRGQRTVEWVTDEEFKKRIDNTRFVEDGPQPGDDWADQQKGLFMGSSNPLAPGAPWVMDHRLKNLEDPDVIGPPFPNSIYESLQDAFKDWLARQGIAATITNRNSKIQAVSGMEQVPSRFSFSISSESTGGIKPISFAFSAGEEADSDEIETEIELQRIDPNWREGDIIKITGPWKWRSELFPDEHESFEIIKVPGGFAYKESGVKLTQAQVLAYYKLQKESLFEEYSQGVNSSNTPDGYYIPKTPMRNVLSAEDAEREVFQNYVKDYPYPRTSPLSGDELPRRDPQQSGANVGGGKYRRWWEPKASDSSIQSDEEKGIMPVDERDLTYFTRTFLKPKNVTGVIEEAANQAAFNHLMAMFNNVTCEVTFEGNPHLVSGFNFMITQAGAGVSGKYMCSKTVHTIRGGTFVTTLHGLKIPQALGLTINHTRTDMYSKIKKIEERYQTLDQAALILETLFSKDGPMLEMQDDEHRKMLKEAGIDLDNVDIKVAPDPAERGMVSSIRVGADTPDELIQMISNPERLEAAREYELKVRKEAEGDYRFIQSKDGVLGPVEETFFKNLDTRVEQATTIPEIDEP